MLNAKSNINQSIKAVLVITALTVSSLSLAASKSYEVINIPAPSLEGSVIENEDTQKIEVHLPPSYNESESVYPVIYYFHGYGGAESESRRIASYKYKNMIKAGEAQEMIIVGVDGSDKFGSSFYVNSPVIGNWEDFVVNDVVKYVDDNYRTIKLPSHRGLAGFSMGGYAALNIGFNHADQFKHVFALSPGIFDETGLVEAHAQWVEGGWTQFLQNYAAAFAPNIKDQSETPWFDYDPSDANIVASWESGFGNVKKEVAQYQKQNHKLDSIYIEYGNGDNFQWIVSGSQYLVETLESHGIAVQSFDHEGKHTLNMTIGTHITKFFSEAFSEVEQTN